MTLYDLLVSVGGIPIKGGTGNTEWYIDKGIEKYEISHDEDLDGEVEVDNRRKIIYVRCD